ncbi:hypothetical protein WJ96_06170 [Burkholderia ubonensis]|uniref:Uncharacterized protein n=1 Tax=Burkholderia ubonensis TaxID=101571 RepID=A0AAW3MWJ5_9BURK|nr:hypothetical protein [Burkholderia ubonensis]KVP75344.1 hypothetical protein WJ93_07975 [Burkholderia ubonensis]KVP96811.1 hypothetical protein WJ97_13100 [Burkholderia ubonensis]KVP98155.1 hypothetical protein WJ96_06170 [Burkholderia ubonensis]KVZ92853.1 hypothetical protein WL25_17835 [Burkholderia ubonensis]
MRELKTASLAEFERLADMLADLAKTEYLSSLELTPKLVVMGADPKAAEQPGYRYGLVPVAELMTSSAGVPGEVVIAALIEKLAQDPEVLVVGYMAEVWLARYTKEARAQMGTTVNPEEAPNREEVLLMNLRSADCVALKTCPLVREGPKTTVGSGDLLFNARHEPQIGRYTH